MQLDKLELITTPDYSGYDQENLREVLSPLEFESFSRWHLGSTGVMHPVRNTYKLLIYKHDFDKWSAGLPNLD